MMEREADRRGFLAKAEENLTSAESEFEQGRYNACANRAYYAAFQAAIAALMGAGVRQPRDRWGHDFVQAQFSGGLVRRRRLYDPSLAEALTRLYRLRRQADYEPLGVGRIEVQRAVARARLLVGAVAERGR